MIVVTLAALDEALLVSEGVSEVYHVAWAVDEATIMAQRAIVAIQKKQLGKKGRPKDPLRKL